MISKLVKEGKEERGYLKTFFNLNNCATIISAVLEHTDKQGE